ncbi:MAG: penicillin-binding protein 2 [Verrucomicrobiota bacterium]
MIKAQQLRRMLALALLLAAAFLGLGYRLVDIQVIRHDELRLRACANTHREYLLQPRRGDIRDIRGNLLATSLPAKTVCADPSLLGNRRTQVAHAIAPCLQLPEPKVLELLSRVTRTNELGMVFTNRYVVLHRKVPMETWRQLQGVMSNLNFGVDEKRLTNKLEARFYRELRQSAIFPDPIEDQIRIYPNQRLAAHVLGYTGMHETELNGRELIETVGMDGMERMLNARLSGVRGWRVTEKDKRNRELVNFREQDVEPSDGLNVVLTLDAGVQFIVESELAEAMKKHTPISVCGMVIRPRTGEVLGLGVLPNYDPNTPGSEPPDFRRNRAISDVQEPGSTFKVVVVSSALTDGLVKLGDTFYCEMGHFAFAGHTLHDHASYGSLSVETIITKSSNIGAAKIGIKMGEQPLYDHIRAFGFGQRTGIALPGEVNGILNPVRQWSKVSIAQIPMGHGVAVTPLQMCMAMAAIANQGVLMQPMLVDRLEDSENNVVAKFQPTPVRRVLTPEASAQMIKALKTVVTKDGTAFKARLDHYSVAGKTGTAQKVENGGYSHDKYFSSFIGFFPADKPELCISVVMDYPKGGHYGGDVCAPVFRQIAERVANYLNIHPDLTPEDKGEKLAGKKGRVLVTASNQ